MHAMKEEAAGGKQWERVHKLKEWEDGQESQTDELLESEADDVKQEEHDGQGKDGDMYGSFEDAVADERREEKNIEQKLKEKLKRVEEQAVAELSKKAKHFGYHPKDMPKEGTHKAWHLLI